MAQVGATVKIEQERAPYKRSEIVTTVAKEVLPGLLAKGAPHDVLDAIRVGERFVNAFAERYEVTDDRKETQ